MTQEYGNYKIQFPDEKSTYFMVIGEGFKNERASFASYDEATAAIDRKEEIRVKMDRKKLALPVVNDHGVKGMITGIHAGHGAIITKPDIKGKYSSSKLLPDVPWICDAILEAASLRDRAEDIEAVLAVFNIMPYSTYESWSESKHSSWVDSIEKNHKRLTAEAIKRGGLGEIPERKKIKL